MDNHNLRFAGGPPATIFNPVIAVIVILAAVLMFCLPQRKVIIPFLLTSILIPATQVLIIAGLHFPLMRIMILIGMVRILIIKGRGNWNIFSGGMNRIDKSLILFALVSAVAGVLLFQNTEVVIYQFGELYTIFGAYFLLRCLIRDQEDVVRVIRVLAFIVVFAGGVMLVEQLTGGWNLYGLLGVVRTEEIVREGSVRSVAAFGQTILAGTFGAVTLPLFIGLWTFRKEHRLAAAFGVVGALTMVITSHSSTPLSGVLAGLIALCLWPIRDSMRIIRWGIVATLVSLHMVMKAPVWDLISRVDLSGGSSSYHRYQLINQCIRHFWDWWLVGTASNGDWGFDMFDTANQYVDTAYKGGLLGLLLFIAIIVYGFKYLGKARRAATDKKQVFFLWALGSALFAHIMSFIGISYWDQNIIGWYALLAFIGAVAVPQMAHAVEPLVRPAWSPKISEALASPVVVSGREGLTVSPKRVYTPLHGGASDR